MKSIEIEVYALHYGIKTIEEMGYTVIAYHTIHERETVVIYFDIHGIYYMEGMII